MPELLPWSLYKMAIGIKWEVPEIIDKPTIIVDSTQFYDDKENTCSSVRDRKNKRILDDSRVNTGSDCPTRSVLG